MASALVFHGPGFVDDHTHLLRVAAGVPTPWKPGDPDSIAAYHRSLSTSRATPMDPIGDPLDMARLDHQLMEGLTRMANAGVVQITEAGIHDWGYLDVLRRRREQRTVAVPRAAARRQRPGGRGHARADG